MPTRYYLRDTQTEPGTGGTVFDLLAAQGTPATQGSGNELGTVFVEKLRYQRDVGTSITGTSFPISINMSAVSAATLEWRAIVRQLDTLNVVIASSDVLGPFNTAGIKTGTLTLSTTWLAGDRLAVSLELRKVSGGGNRNFTVAVNDADSYVDATFGATAVGDTVQPIWNVRAALGDTSEYRWNVRSAIGDTVQAIWNVLVNATAIGDIVELQWKVRQAVGKASQTIWNVAGVVSQTRQAIWNVATALGDTIEARWHVRQAIAQTGQAVWNVRAFLGKAVYAVWNVRSAVGDTIQAIWHVKTVIGDTVQTIWNVLTNASAVWDIVELRWHVKQAVGQVRQVVWHVRGAVGDTAQAIWRVAATAGDTLQAIWNVLTTIGDTNEYRWKVSVAVGQTRQVAWNVAGAIGDTIQARWNVLKLVLGDVLKESYVVDDDDFYWPGIYGVNWQAQTFTPAATHVLSKLRFKVYRTLNPGTVTVSIRAVDGNGQPTGSDLNSAPITFMTGSLPTDPPGEWITPTFSQPQAPLTLNTGTKYAVVLRALSGNVSNKVHWRRDLAGAAYSFGNVEASSNSGSSWTAASDSDFMFEEYGAGNTTAVQAKWRVRSMAAKTAQAIWNIRTTIGQTRQAVWNVAQTVGDAVQAVWHVRTVVGAAKQAVWNVATSVGKTTQAIWHVAKAVGDTVQARWVVHIGTLIGRNVALRWRLWHTKSFKIAVGTEVGDTIKGTEVADTMKVVEVG